MAFKPWYTSNDLISSIKRKISFPVSQTTFTDQDILAFANEEMMISQVPSVMLYHEEYFVYRVTVPLKNNVSRYSIPDRAIGMRIRDVVYQDISGNWQELTRISPDDKAYWQSSSASFESVHKFYMEGNDVVLIPDITSASGSLVFSIYLRPNQLVLDDRACVSTNFVKTVTLASVQAGDTVTIGDTTFTAVASGATSLQFNIGVSDALTATNLAAAITASDVAEASNGSPATAIVTIKYNSLDTEISSSNSARLSVQTTQGIEFDQVPTTWLNPDTNVNEALYADGEYVDFLQMKPGHRTYCYDKKIPVGGISGTIINFTAADVPDDFIIGDYICLANECIIPQIPPDLHNGLAERTCARILSAIGDQAGMQSTMTKVQEIENRQGTLLDNRTEGAPQKITGRRGLLRYGKRSGSWRW